MKQIETNRQFYPTAPTVYGAGRFILRQRTGGKLQIVEEADALEIIRSASVPVQFSPTRGWQGEQLSINPSDYQRLCAPAKARGIHYLICVESFESKQRGVVRKKDGRKNLIGGLGISYRVQSVGTALTDSIGLTVWDTASGRVVLAEKCEVMDAQALWTEPQLEEYLGMAVVQRLMPFAIDIVENPHLGDYSLSVSVGEKLEFYCTGAEQTGIPGKTVLLDVTRVSRVGSEVRITTRIANYWDDTLRLRVGDTSEGVFCLDMNRRKYAGRRLSGPSRPTLRPNDTILYDWVFDVPDRNVGFLNMHLHLSGTLGSRCKADADVVFRDIPLFERPTGVEDLKHPTDTKAR